MRDEFRQIRSLGAGQHEAFEEFCCQLALREPVPDASTFHRIRGAGGDGGVECYWVLPDGSEWGWQAKYLSSLDKAQIESSVRMAIKIHPKLTRYTVCGPFDPTGPTGRHGESELEKWERWVEEWEQIAAEEGMTVVFELLGGSMLWDRFLEIDPSGGRRYWFGLETLTEDWFRSQIADAVTSAGPRYTPELSVDVPVARALEVFGRHEGISQLAERTVADLRSSADELASEIQPNPQDPEGTPMGDVEHEELVTVVEKSDAFQQLLMEWAADPTSDDLSQLRQTRDELAETASDLEARLAAALDERYGDRSSESVGFRQFMAEYQVSFPAGLLDTIREVVAALERLDVFLESKEAMAAMADVLLISGAAGVGKTHSILDSAVQRLGEGALSVVALGNWFGRGEPLGQLRDLLGLPNDLGSEEMLAALATAAEASGHPLIIFLDALNETTPRTVWRDHLQRVVNRVLAHDGLRLCFSVRTPYLSDVVPEALDPLLEVKHTGFEHVLFEAVDAFFDHYDVPAPVAPILVPEATNPLFLKLLCETLQFENSTGHEAQEIGISRLFERLMVAKNTEISRQLDVDAREDLTERAILGIANQMIKGDVTWLPWPAAKATVDEIRPGATISDSLFNSLISSGLLREDKFRDQSGDLVEGITFGFERIGHHIVATELVGEVPDVTSAWRRIRTEAPSLAADAGMLTALSIVLAERLGLEITSLVNEVGRDVVVAAVINGIPWRSSAAVTEETRDIVAEGLSQPSTFNDTMEALLSTACRPDHLLNANYLNEILFAVQMPDRDAFWCPYLYHAYDSGGSVDRIIGWARREGHQDVGEEIAYLWGSTLLWFCAASDRRVRDRASRGLTEIMAAETSVMPLLIEDLSVVDDDYIAERLFACAYGALLKTDDRPLVEQVARLILQHVFAREEDIWNAMVRDHARLIVEMAYDDGLVDEAEVKVARPPYQSPWPLTWPEEGDVEQVVSDKRGYPKLAHSCLHDDFATYIVDPGLGDYDEVYPDAAKRWILRHVLDMGYTPERFAAFDQHILWKYGQGRSRPSWAERIGKKYQWIAWYRILGIIADHEERTRHSWDPPESEIPDLQAYDQRDLDPSPTIPAAYAKGIQDSSWTYGVSEHSGLSDEEWVVLDDLPMSRVDVAWDSSDAFILMADRTWRKPDTSQAQHPYRLVHLRLRSVFVDNNDLEEALDWFEGTSSRRIRIAEPSDMHGPFVGEWPDRLPSREFRRLRDHEGNFHDAPVEMRPTAHQVTAGDSRDHTLDEALTLWVPAVELFDLGLHWHGEPIWRDSEAASALANTIDGDLVVLARHLDSVLTSQDLSIIWVETATKDIVSLGIEDHSRLVRTRVVGLSEQLHELDPVLEVI